MWCVIGTAASASGQIPQTPPQPDSTGSVTGVVIARDGGVPLAYGVVSIAALGREQFTNDRGAFLLDHLPPGRYRLRVRHLGYTPAEIDVAVRPGATDTVRVQLTHIAVRLNAVQVRAYPECKNPEPPRRSADSAFSTVFDQLRQNAEQYRLLINEYPFLYGVQRTLSVTFGRGNVRPESVDTINSRSQDDWRYTPGSVVTRERRRLRPDGPPMMRIPTLSHFADSVFLTNHRFHNGGAEEVDGVELLRIDFVAASRIRDPDVDGSMYLDPATFQIRRAFLHLSKTPSDVPDLLETEATTWFSELLPPSSTALDPLQLPARMALLRVWHYRIREEDSHARSCQNSHRHRRRGCHGGGASGARPGRGGSLPRAHPRRLRRAVG